MCLIAFIGGRERTRVWETVGRFPPPCPKNVKVGVAKRCSAAKRNNQPEKFIGVADLQPSPHFIIFSIPSLINNI